MTSWGDILRGLKPFEISSEAEIGSIKNFPSFNLNTTLSKKDIQPYNTFQIKGKLLFHLAAPTFMLPSTLSQGNILAFDWQSNSRVHCILNGPLEVTSKAPASAQQSTALQSDWPQPTSVPTNYEQLQHARNNNKMGTKKEESTKMNECKTIKPRQECSCNIAGKQ